MKIKVATLFVFFLGTMLLAACDFSLAADITPPPGAQQAPPTSPVQQASNGPVYPLVAPQPANGEAIYTEKCAPCHGDLGMGNGPQADQLPNPVPPIGRKAEARTAIPSEWYSVVTNGNLERYMPPFSSLSEGQRWDVVAYVLSLSASSAELETGRELYEQNCSACHGLTGEGDGASANSLPVRPTNFSNQELMAQRSAAELFASISMGAGEAMPAFADQFSEDEIWSLAAYLRSLSFAGDPVEVAENFPEESAEDSSSGESQSDIDPESQLAIQTGVVKGQLINGSGGSLPEDITVTLHGLDHMEIISTATTTSNEDGTYVFEEVEFAPDRVYVVTAELNGATYGSDVSIVEPGQEVIELPVTIYQTTSDNSSLSIDRLHVFFDFSRPDVVQVVELYVISNPSDLTVVPSEEGAGSIEFTLPVGASNLQFQDGTLGGRYIPTDSGFADTNPILPGQGGYQVMYAFDMPYANKLELEQTFNLPVEAMIIMTPSDGVKLRSKYLQDTGSRDVQGETFQMYTGSRLDPGEQFGFTLSGLPGEMGMLSFTSTSMSSTSLVIGLAALGLVLVGAGVWLYRKNARDLATLEQDENPEYEEAGEVYQAPETVMDAIIALDDLYASGELPEDTYQKRRSELKEQLRTLTEES